MPVPSVTLQLLHPLFCSVVDNAIGISLAPHSPPLLSNKPAGVTHVFAVAFPVDFGVLVLTNGSWPFQQGAEMRLPVELVKCQERFTMFYSVSLHPLLWLWFGV